MDIFEALGRLLGWNQEDKKKKPQQPVVQQPMRPMVNTGNINIPNGNRPQAPQIPQAPRPSIAPSVNTAIINAPKPAALQAPKPTFNTGLNSLLTPGVTPPQPKPTQPQNDWFNDVGNTINEHVIKPIAEDVGKAYNTVAAPITGLTGAAMVGAENLFNGGRNANNLAAAAKAAVNENVRKSFVPQNVAQGKATPAQFAQEFTKTGIKLAPYAVNPSAGGLTGAFGSKVAGGIANGVANKVVSSAAKNAAGAAIAAPVFAGLNAAQQGMESNFRSFDPGQAINSGLQAGALTLGSGVAGDLMKGGANATSAITRAVSKHIDNITSQPGYNPQAGSIKIPGKANDAEALRPVRQGNRPLQTAEGRQQLPPESRVSGQTVPTSLQEMPLERPSANNTLNSPVEQLHIKAYLKQQLKQQEAARKEGKVGPLKNLKDAISVKMIDSLSPIENTLKKAIKDGADIKIGDSNHITPQLDRAIRSDTIAGQYIKDKGLADVIQKVPDTKAFDQYLIAKHAADLEANGVKTGRNLDADKQLVESLKGTYEPHAQAVTKYNQELLDKTVEYGLVSKETAAALKKQYPNYVPANRIFGEGEKPAFKGNGSGKASISSQSVVQKIKGSSREIESPLASIAAKTQDVIKQGERNKAASILASYKDLPGNPFGLRELGKSETVGTKPTISYLDRGKIRRFETTPEIAAAAKSLNKEQMNIIGKIVTIPTRTLRLGATGINVGFAMANLAKDMASAAINSKHPLRSSVLNPKVLAKATSASLYHGGKSYGELVREGAGGTSFDIARDAPKQTVGQIRAEKNAGTKALYNVTHPGEMLRAVENTIGRSEEFTRALQYYGNKDAALSKGMSESDAARYGAHAARNNTVNFARAGEYGAVLNSALPYLNAGIQGARTFVRNVKERPAQTAAKVAVLSTLPAVTTTLWNISDPERKAAYDDISDYEKEGNIIIVPERPVKDEATGRWNVIKIPVSQEVAKLNNIARNGVEASAGDANFDVAAALGDLIGTTTSINAQSSRGLLNQVTPQIIKPGVEMMTNQNLFTGNQIVPNSQKNLPAEDQYSDYTSGTAKVLGKTFGLSPRMLDNGFKTTTGGAGQTAINLSDKALAGLGAIKPEEIQGKSFEDSVSNRFIGAASKPPSDAAGKAYESKKNELIKDPAYRALSQEDRAKALNRLQTDVNALEYNKQDGDKLTKNQTALSSGNRSISDYATATGTKAPSETYADKYKTAKDAYDQNSKNWSTVQKAKKEKELASLAFKKDYSNDTVDLYDMSKKEVYNLVNKDPDGKKKVEDILAYGDALVKAGLADTNKYRDKYGNLKLDDGAKQTGSGKKKGKGKKGGAAKFKMPKTSFNRVASTAGIRKLLQSSGKKLKEKV